MSCLIPLHHAHVFTCTIDEKKSDVFKVSKSKSSKPSKQQPWFWNYSIRSLEIPFCCPLWCLWGCPQLKVSAASSAKRAGPLWWAWWWARRRRGQRNPWRIGEIPKMGGEEIYGDFLKCWYPTIMGFPTKNDHFGVFWGYHHLKKPPYTLRIQTFLCRVGLMVETSHPQNRIVGEIPFSGHT